MLETPVHKYMLRAPAGLRQAWERWQTADTKGLHEQFSTCLEFVEVLSREIAILAFSAGADELPSRLATEYTPEIARDFGTEVKLLQRLKDTKQLRGLVHQKPGPGDGLSALSRLVEVLGEYLGRSDGAGPAWVADQMRADPKGRVELWLTALDGFRKVRNLYVHGTAHPLGGVPTYVTPKLRDALHSQAVVEATSRWAEWLTVQAVRMLDSYEIAGREGLLADARTRPLLEQVPLEDASGAQLYVECREGRVPVRVFPRLEKPQQIRRALTARSELPQSPLFLAASAGTLMAVVGPEFGYPSRPSADGAVEVVRRASEAVASSEGEAVPAFLSRLVSDRLRLEEPLEFPAERRQECGPKAALVDCLARIAIEGTRVFGKALLAEAWPLTGGCVVPLGKEEAEALSASLEASSAWIREQVKVRALDDSRMPDLGAASMAQDLVRLAGEIRIPPRHISLHQVERLTDLVWHALRWDAPFFPDSESFALQMELGASRNTMGRPYWDRAPTSSGSALFLEQTACQQYLTDWLTRMEQRLGGGRARRISGAAGPRDDYRTLARAMTLCLHRRYPLAFPGVDSQAVFVVDAGFHRRMSGALSELQIPAAVVFPIYVGDVPAWGMRRFPASKEVPTYEVLGDDDYTTIDRQDMKRVVVIKPFGSPCEELAPIREAVQRLRREPGSWLSRLEGGGSGEVRHRILLDDISILHDVVRKEDSMPPGFRQVVHGESRGLHGQPGSDAPAGDTPWQLYFLGYPLDEQGRRARMLADVRPRDDKSGAVRSAPPPTCHYVSQPPPEGLAWNYLTRADVRRHQTPLSVALDDLEANLQHLEEGGDA